VRSTIFTDLGGGARRIRHLGAAVAVLFAALLAASAAAAQVPEGCFARDYSPEHLAANPGQVVAKMRLSVYDGVADIAVILSDRPDLRAAGLAGGAEFAALDCQEFGCVSICGDGYFRLDGQDASSITIEVWDLMTMGQGATCEARINLSERPGAPTRYRLDYLGPEPCQ